MQALNEQPDDRTQDTPALIRTLLRDVLTLPQDQVDAFQDDTPLFGALPELDSMAVAGILTEMEDRMDIIIEDDDIDGDTFETFGTLVAFARSKVKG